MALGKDWLNDHLQKMMCQPLQENKFHRQ